MVKKKQSHPKHVKVTHAHHKPYRKRHYAVLIASLALGVALINSLVMYANDQYVGSQIASQSIADLFDVQDNQANRATVASTYGFKLSYNTNRYSGSAVDATSGGLYVDNELATARAYNVIRIADQRVKAQDATSFKLTYYQNDKPTSTNLSTLETTYITQKQSNPKQLVKDSSDQRVYGGVNFLRTQWHRQLPTTPLNITANFTTYTGLVNGSPITVIASEGVSSGSKAEDIMKTFSTSNRVQAALPLSNVIASKYNNSLKFIDSMFGISTASAASTLPNPTASERISATYGSAVVKVYNVMVGDLAIDGQVVIKDHLTGGTGSGFIVNGDGYIATNGHVAVIDARDEILTYAINALNDGNTGPMLSLVDMSGTTNADVAGAKSSSDVLKIVIQNLYKLPSSRFAFVNAKQNLLVGLGEKQVDIQALVDATGKKQSYPTEATIKAATLKQADYDGTILPMVTGKYTKSDVALIKIDGSNYPMVKLGDFGLLEQGGNLNIMGYPGIGSSNGIVSETKTAATLTTGKVSSKKQDTGNHSLIETDTEIGHGNSGGPAFGDDGGVVGIATYAVDPGGYGDGTLNYVRSIDDFKSIATKSSVNYTLSETQRIWNEGIQQFYTAHYKNAVSSFAQVKELYPAHPRVAELTAVAEKRIANGENIDDFPVAIVVVLAVVVLAGVGVSVFFIVRHKRGHNAMVQGVVSGQVQPMMPGAPAQMIPAAVPPAQLFGQPSVPPVQPAGGQPFGQNTVPQSSPYGAPQPQQIAVQQPDIPSVPAESEWSAPAPQEQTVPQEQVTSSEAMQAPEDTPTRPQPPLIQ